MDLTTIISAINFFLSSMYSGEVEAGLPVQKSDYSYYVSADIQVVSSPSAQPTTQTVDFSFDRNSVSFSGGGITGHSSGTGYNIEFYPAQIALVYPTTSEEHFDVQMNFSNYPFQYWDSILLDDRGAAIISYDQNYTSMRFGYYSENSGKVSEIVTDDPQTTYFNRFYVNIPLNTDLTYQQTLNIIEQSYENTNYSYNWQTDILPEIIPESELVQPPPTEPPTETTATTTTGAIVTIDTMQPPATQGTVLPKYTMDMGAVSSDFQYLKNMTNNVDKKRPFWIVRLMNELLNDTGLLPLFFFAFLISVLGVFLWR